MANQEQLDILKQGVEVWNKWRKENAVAEIDLFIANLSKSNLEGVNLDKADLSRADLVDTNLSKACLSGADFSGANLREANLSEADLSTSDFIGTNLNRANLNGSDLSKSNFIEANLKEADLRGSNLRGSNLNGSNLHRTNFSETNLCEANLTGTSIGNTVFADIDFSETLGLEVVFHDFPSFIDTSTIKKSKGKIPENFLRGCGLSDVDIEYSKLANPDLSNEEINKIVYRVYDLRATQALQISPLFISYSHADSAFVDKLEKGLNAKGVRFWRDVHDMKAGRIETQIDRAIRQNPTVLLILSKNSMNSDWVQHEVRKARDLEKELGRDALCPIALDDGWKSSHWPQRVMEQVMEYNILDFSQWEDEPTFNSKFAKLLSGLDLFYKKSE